MRKEAEPTAARFGELGGLESLVAGVRLGMIFLWLLICLPVYATAMALSERAQTVCNRVFWKGVLRLANIRVRVHGRVAATRPLLVVSNHISYLDIPVLGSLIPGFFVAKADVAGWPGLGVLAKLGRTVFVERKRAEAARQKVELTARLAHGTPLILFPEGTSSDGNRVLPFKSTLFSIAEEYIEGQPVVVQPVAVAYTHCFGVPIGYLWRHFFAWYGDMDLAPHLWSVLRMGRLTVEVNFLEPRLLSALGSRKNAAAVCHEAVKTALGRAHTGHRA
ncbi:MAG: lysophospholipid acyltransferase family protein [Rhodospirillaceae bacterium]